MTIRRRFTQTNSLEDRLTGAAQQLLESAKLLPPGPVREAAIRKARQMTTAALMKEWLSSPGLEPPK